MKKSIWGIVAVIIIIVVAGAYFLFRGTSNTGTPPPPPAENTPPPAVTPPVDNTKTVMGTSAGGRQMVAYHYGTTNTDAKEIIFVGGIHGGYEWNTSLLAYEAMDYFEKNPSSVPAGIKVTVIPVLNPDGLSKVVSKDGSFVAGDITASQEVQISGRYNANGVDLNRNFDCDWKATGVWQNKPVSGGASAFSEPESQAMKAYVEAHEPVAVVMLNSAGGGIFASNCGSGILPETKTMMNVYAKASTYKANDAFNFYAITGDMTNWLAKNNIPAMSILLTNHTDTEWTKNKAGIDALLSHVAESSQ